LTNDASMNLNPMEINDVYEEVWNVGVLLQSEDSLSCVDLDYRPWPKIKADTDESKEFYRIHDRNKQAQSLIYNSTLTLNLSPLLSLIPNYRLIWRHLGRMRQGRTQILTGLSCKKSCVFSEKEFTNL
jgi:hypothetical protein